MEVGKGPKWKVLYDNAAFGFSVFLFAFRVNEWFGGFYAGGDSNVHSIQLKMSWTFRKWSKAISKVKMEPNGKWHKKRIKWAAKLNKKESQPHDAQAQHSTGSHTCIHTYALTLTSENRKISEHYHVRTDASVPVQADGQRQGKTLTNNRIHKRNDKWCTVHTAWHCVNRMCMCGKFIMLSRGRAIELQTLKVNKNAGNVKMWKFTIK